MSGLVKTNDREGIVEIQMCRKPVNALNLELLEDIHNAIDENTGQGAKDLMLSGMDGIFTAGLDVKTLLTLSRDEIDIFFKAFWGLMAKISKSPIPFVAAMTGHSPAGGTVLSIFCDYRIAAKGDYKIGMNEVFVGLPVPMILYKALSRLVGENKASTLTMTGSLISFQEAEQLGLLNEIVEKDQVVERTFEWLGELVQLPPNAMNLTRLTAKSELNDWFDNELGQFTTSFADGWFSDEVQSRMKYIAENYL